MNKPGSSEHNYATATVDDAYSSTDAPVNTTSSKTGVKIAHALIVALAYDWFILICITRWFSLLHDQFWEHLRNPSVWTELLLDAILLSSLPLLCKQSRSYCHRYYPALAHMLHCWNFTCQAKKPLMSPRCIKIIVAIALVTAAVVIPVLLLLGKRSDTGSLSAGILFPCSFFGALLFKPNHLGIVVFEKVQAGRCVLHFFLSS